MVDSAHVRNAIINAILALAPRFPCLAGLGPGHAHADGLDFTRGARSVPDPDYEEKLRRYRAADKVADVGPSPTMTAWDPDGVTLRLHFSEERMEPCTGYAPLRPPEYRNIDLAVYRDCGTHATVRTVQLWFSIEGPGASDDLRRALLDALLAVDAEAGKELLKQAFATQAESYTHPLKARFLEDVSAMLDLVAPRPSERLLDVGTGSGFTALGFAGRVRRVVGVDVTEAAVDVARRQAAARNVANAEFRTADPESLPFPEGSFEIVTCRFVFHHFQNPERALQEMKRVLAAGGRIMLYDILASDNDDAAEIHNRIERARDPSHVRMLQAKEFLSLFRRTGLVPRAKDVILTRREFDEWMEIVGADAETLRRTRALIEWAGGRSGLGVRIEGGKITLTQTNVAWLLVPQV